jgi:uncharacterized lipoprotein
MSRHLVFLFRPRWQAIIIISVVALMSACKSGGGGSSDEQTYQSARTLPPLDVPPDLSQFPPSEEYSQPATEERVTAAAQIPEDSQPPVSEEIRDESQAFGEPGESGGTAFSEDQQGEAVGGLVGVAEPDAVEENPEDFVPENITTSMMSNDSLGPYLSVTAPFHIIWQQLGLGLDMEQVSILDRDRTNGRYYIDCESMEEEAEPGEKKRKGWFFGFGKERKATDICLLNVAMDDGRQGDLVSEDSPGSGDIFLTTDDGKNVDPEKANRFLERMQRHFG